MLAGQDGARGEDAGDGGGGRGRGTEKAVCIPLPHWQGKQDGIGDGDGMQAVAASAVMIGQQQDGNDPTSDSFSATALRGVFRRRGRRQPCYRQRTDVNGEPKVDKIK